MTSDNGWAASKPAASENFVPGVDVLEAAKMGKRKDLDNFDKSLTVMAGRPDQSNSKLQGYVG